MRRPGLVIFILFFGLALLDALWTRHWARALFWIGMGMAFVWLERTRSRRRPTNSN